MIRAIWESLRKMKEDGQLENLGDEDRTAELEDTAMILAQLIGNHGYVIIHKDQLMQWINRGF